MSNVATRMSFPGFAIIKNEGGDRFGLVADMEFGSGLMPIGGALHGTARGLSRLMRQYGVSANAFDPGAAAALRFVAPNQSVQPIADWFFARVERDTSIQRVLFNSMFEETATLTRSEARSASEQFVGFSQMRDVSFRGNVWERNTLYLIECYRVTFPGAIMRKLHYQSGRLESNFHFVTPAEIMAGKTSIGSIPIAPISKSLLNPQMPQQRRQKKS